MIPLIPKALLNKVKPYCYPHSQKTEIEKMVTAMLEEGLIEPYASPFLSSIPLVEKRDGTWRFCINYRPLNIITVKDAFPILTVHKLLDELHSTIYFSRLDLYISYHQLLHPNDHYKKGVSHLIRPLSVVGHALWVIKHPSHVSNFDENIVFSSFPCKNILIFLDNILVYYPSWDLHLAHLESVLSTL